MKKIFKLAGEITIEGLKKAQSDIKSLETATKKAIAPLVRYGRQVENIGKQFTTSFTLPLAAAGAAVWKFTEAASDSNEALSKMNEIFGESAGAIEEWSKGAAAAIGQTASAAQESASTFALFGKAAGKTGDELVDFSTSFTELASDLASFNNTSPEEAVEAITAALRGQARPMQKYGVLIDANRMKQKALEKGIISNMKNALTPEQKILAATELIYEQTTAAQGDFARTSDGLANQQRILAAELGNLSGELGEAFLPVVLKLVDTFRSKFIPRIRTIAKWLKNMDKEVLEARLRFLAMIAVMGPLLIGIGKFIGMVKTIPAMLTAVRLAMVALNSTLLANPWTLAIAGVVALGVAIVNLTKKYDKLKGAHEQTVKIMTTTAAAQDKFATSVEELNKEIQKSGVNVNNLTELEERYGEKIDEIAEKASALNKRVEGNTQARYVAINAIMTEIRGVRSLTKGVEKYDGTVKEVTDTEHEWTEEEKALAEQIDKNNARIQKERRKAMQDEYKAEQDRRAKNFNSIKQWEKKTAEFKENMEDRYLRAAATTANERITILEEEMKDELAVAKRLEIDKANIEKYYNGLIQDIRDEEREAFTEDLTSRLSMVGDFVQQAAGLFSGYFDNQEARLDQNYQKDKERIEGSLMSEEQKTKALEALDEEYTANKKRLARKQAIVDKASALFSIGINTASAIVEALPNVILASIIGAFGAIQAAIVASKPIPQMAEGGVVKATTGGTLVHAAEAGEDEAFIPMTKGTASIANAIIDNMKRETGAASGLAAGTSLTASTPISFHIGTFIGDDSGIKELTRRIIPYITTENRRKGLVV